MIKIYPKINSYQNQAFTRNNTSANQKHYQNNLSSDTVSFKGCYPSSSKNRYYINKIVQLLKSSDVKRIAIIAHAAPDEDAIGASLAFKQMVKKLGKKVNMFILNPPQENIKFIDTNNEITVINKNPKMHASIEEISTKYKDYDTVICIDTSSIKLFDEELYEAFVKNAKHKIKIDHHPNQTTPDYNYADINFVDSTKESASQIVMEFAKAFVCDTKKLGNKISDPLTLGIMGDSGFLRFARGESIYKDIGILSRSTNIRKITDEMKRITRDELISYGHILGNNITVRDDGIAYAIIDVAKETKPIKNVRHMVLDQMSNTKGIKYYFTVMVNSQDPEWKISAQIRSIEKPIKAAVMSLGGGGHDFASGFDDKEGRSAEEITDIIIHKLQEVKNLNP